MCITIVQQSKGLQNQTQNAFKFSITCILHEIQLYSNKHKCKKSYSMKLKITIIYYYFLWTIVINDDSEQVIIVLFCFK